MAKIADRRTHGFMHESAICPSAISSFACYLSWSTSPPSPRVFLRWPIHWETGRTSPLSCDMHFSQSWERCRPTAKETTIGCRPAATTTQACSDFRSPFQSCYCFGHRTRTNWQAKLYLFFIERHVTRTQIPICLLLLFALHVITVRLLITHIYWQA